MKKKFSEFVKNKRASMGLSQHEFAELIGVSWMTIWRWENGAAKPRPDALNFWIEVVEKVRGKNG